MERCLLDRSVAFEYKGVDEALERLERHISEALKPQPSTLNPQPSTLALTLNPDPQPLTLTLANPSSRPRRAARCTTQCSASAKAPC